MNTFIKEEDEGQEAWQVYLQTLHTHFKWNKIHKILKNSLEVQENRKICDEDCNMKV